MIKITVELISARDGHREILSEALLFNDGTGTPTRGNYEMHLGKKGYTFQNVFEGRGHFRRGKVKNFPRKQKNVWYLIHEALDDIFGTRKGEAKDETVSDDSEH